MLKTGTNLLGKEVKDVVTGFTGKVLAMSTYLYEETIYFVQPIPSDPVVREMPKGKWLTLARLELV